MPDETESGSATYWTDKIRDAICDFVHTHECDCSGPDRVVISPNLSRQLSHESKQFMSPKERVWSGDLLFRITSISTIFGEVDLCVRSDVMDSEFVIELDGEDED